MDGRCEMSSRRVNTRVIVTLCPQSDGQCKCALNSSAVRCDPHPGLGGVGVAEKQQSEATRRGGVLVMMRRAGRAMRWEIWCCIRILGAGRRAE